MVAIPASNRGEKSIANKNNSYIPQSSSRFTQGLFIWSELAWYPGLAHLPGLKMQSVYMIGASPPGPIGTCRVESKLISDKVMTPCRNAYGCTHTTRTQTHLLIIHTHTHTNTERREHTYTHNAHIDTHTQIHIFH